MSSRTTSGKELRGDVRIRQAPGAVANVGGEMCCESIFGTRHYSGVEFSFLSITLMSASSFLIFNGAFSQVGRPQWGIRGRSR